MPIETHVLVVANETLESPDLARELERRAAHGRLRVTLLAPSPVHDRTASAIRIQRVVQRLTEAGIPASGTVGDSIALVAVSEVWRPERYDEIIVSTLPARVSRWLRIDLPSRLAERTGAAVTHVTASASTLRATTPPASGNGCPPARGARRRRYARGRGGSWSYPA